MSYFKKRLRCRYFRQYYYQGDTFVPIHRSRVLLFPMGIHAFDEWDKIQSREGSFAY